MNRSLVRRWTRLAVVFGSPLVLPPLLASLALGAESAVAQAPAFARLAPYADILWPDSTPERPQILLGRDWFELVSIDGLAVPEVIAAARLQYGGGWQRRFDEDLVEVLRGAGRPPAATVELGLRSGGSPDVLTRSVEMNAQNRGAIMRAKAIRGGALPPGGAAARPTALTGEQIARDLAALQNEMETRWAYLKTNNVDYRTAIARVRERGTDGMDHGPYGLEVRRIISMFIDGHASVGGFSYPSGSMPFRIEASAGRYVAVRYDRAGFVDPGHPYIGRIDGRPIGDWLAAAAPYVTRSSPQWVERNSLAMVQRLGFLRMLLGLPEGGAVRVELVSSDGRTRSEVTVDEVSGSPAEQPFRQSGTLDGNIGYLRIPDMTSEAAYDVDQWMPRLRETAGLIVDVRGNGGGTRDALRALFPYLMSETDAPRVVNAAKYRLHPEYAQDHLGGSRFMYRESWDGWTPEERSAIAQFKTTFRPQWTPPEAEFSEWHYLVMSRRMNPRAFVYGKPVVVLMDAGSFSATDIFVNALKGWRDVTLVGTPSGGGSARQVPVTLPFSRVSFTLASMASFQWSGRLYDGNGTQPDVLVHPEPEAFLIGGRDNVLERALQILR